MTPETLHLPEVREPNKEAEQFIATHTILPDGEQLPLTTYRLQEGAPDTLRLTTQRAYAEDERYTQVVRVSPGHRVALITKSGDEIAAYVLDAQKGTLFRRGNFDTHSYRLINSLGEWGVLNDEHDTSAGDVMVPLEHMDWVKAVGIDYERGERSPEPIDIAELSDEQREELLLPGQVLDAIRQHLIHNS
ncbi:MAG: hypothetical protein ACREGJ_00575 [Candidatus Saccharimonadales bacterium]